MPWRRPVDDIESLFGHEEAKAKRESDAEARARLERMDRLANEAEELQRQEAKRWLMRGNDQMIENGYRALGLEPPAVAPGQILLSVDMMLSLGWTIEDYSGKKVLVRPPPPEKFDGFRDNDSLPPNDKPTRKKRK